MKNSKTSYIIQVRYGKDDEWRDRYDGFTGETHVLAFCSKLNERVDLIEFRSIKRTITTEDEVLT